MTSGYPEGKVAKEIEQRTKKIPSDVFLWGAAASIGLSLALRVMDRERDSSFVASWAPTLLILGLYNKLVKLHGSESGTSRVASAAGRAYQEASET